MSAEFVRHLVREWVGLYTHGLPAEVRVGRIDEIESDLWSHTQEAESRAEADSALAIAILTRWLLGIDADIAWRLERGRLADRNTERITTMGTPDHGHPGDRRWCCSGHLGHQLGHHRPRQPWRPPVGKGRLDTVRHRRCSGYRRAERGARPAGVRHPEPR